ncbi:sensor histidine kinase [Holdemania massiliensis]|uniref:sensor histidine kinase n=2 Tax=Holdemania massiliensis TaxID=1468449 RepID=UPI0002F3CF23|nr:HAMP domain-containing sensor histidine kinase [Holdemania massiliensis]
MFWIFILTLLFLMIFIFKLVCWKKQIRKINIQLQEILNEKTQKFITLTLMDKNLEKMTVMINELAERGRISIGQAQIKEEKQKENISCLTHDLRTPLTSIRGYLELMQNASDEKRAQYMEALVGKAIRLEQLINDFYQISLLDDNEISYKKEMIELNKLVTEVILDNHSLFENRKIIPEIQLAEEDIFLDSDKTALTRIFQNLIINAIRSTAGKLSIRLITNDRELKVSIQNSMKEDFCLDSTKIFDRFYSGDISRGNGNSGQGLYIVKKLLAQLGCEEPRVNITKESFEIIVNLSSIRTPNNS